MALLSSIDASDAINCGTGVISGTATTFTVCMWTTIDSGFDQSDNRLFVKSSAGSNGFDFRLSGSSTTNALNFLLTWGRATTQLAYVTSGEPLIRDVWNFIAVSGDQSASAGNTVKFYVGGLTTPAALTGLFQADDGAGAYGDHSAGEFIIRNHRVSNRSPRGSLATVAVTSEALTHEQILAVQSNFTNAFSNTVTGWWDVGMVADESSAQPDYSGNGNTGIVTAFTSVPHPPINGFRIPLILPTVSAFAPINIDCTLGQVEVSGQTADVAVGVAVECSLGQVQVSGQTADVAVGIAVECTLGQVEVSGQTADVAVGIAVECLLGQVEVAGLTADVAVGVAVECTLGQVEVAGHDALVTNAVEVDCTLGVVEVAGLDATIEFPVSIDCTLGQVEVAGHDALVTNAVEVDCTLGQVQVSGLNADVAVGVAVECTLGQVQVSGLNADVAVGIAVDCTLGVVEVAGLDATVTQFTIIECTLGEVQVAGFNAAVIVNEVIECTLGRVEIAGLTATIIDDGALAQGRGGLRGVIQTRLEGRIQQPAMTGVLEPEVQGVIR